MHKTTWVSSQTVRTATEAAARNVGYSYGWCIQQKYDPVPALPHKCSTYPDEARVAQVRCKGQGEAAGGSSSRAAGDCCQARGSWQRPKEGAKGSGSLSAQDAADRQQGSSLHSIDAVPEACSEVTACSDCATRAFASRVLHTRFPHKLPVSARAGTCHTYSAQFP